MIPELRDILFLDIETVANTNDYQSLDERIKTQWSRKKHISRTENFIVHKLTQQNVTSAVQETFMVAQKTYKSRMTHGKF